jgi:hypothetical protein
MDIVIEEKLEITEDLIQFENIFIFIRVISFYFHCVSK